MKGLKMFTSRSQLLRAGSVVLEWTLGIALLGLIYVHFAPNVKGVPGPAAPAGSAAAAESGGGVAAILAACGTGTFCITDDVTGDHFNWSCPSGAYTFTRCSDGFTISGNGTPTTVNGVEWLQAFLPDRRISADLLLTQGTGRVSISFKTGAGMYQNFVINQRIPFAPCGTCAAALKKPKG